MTTAQVATFEEARRLASAEAKAIAWPTVWLAAALFALFYGSMALALAGLAPLWLLAPVTFYTLVGSQTPVHEAIHRNISAGKPGWGWLDLAVGYALSPQLLVSFTIHGYAHLRHHSNVNDPREDPDRFIFGSNVPMFLLRCVGYLTHQNLFFMRNHAGKPKSRGLVARAIAEQSIPFVMAGFLIAAGQWKEFLFVWLIPAQCASIYIFALATWAPHRQPSGPGQYGNTLVVGAPRGILGTLMTWAYFGGNFHLYHHVFPRVPFYKNRELWHRCENVLKAEGARVYPFFADKAAAG